MEENRPEKVTETEEKTAISQETEKTQTTSQEIAETEEMKIIADEKAETADDQKTERNEANSGRAEEKTISPEDAAKMAEKRKIIDKGKAPMEERRPDKVAKMEDNQETEKNQTTSKETAEMEVICEEEEEMEISSEEASKMENKKIISDVKAEMAVDKKTEDADSSREKRKIISEGKAPMAEEQIRYRDYDDYADIFDKFLAENRPTYELNVDQSWAGADYFFMDMGACAVYTAYKKAFQSKSIEKLSHELKKHGKFSGILVMFCMQCHKKFKKTDLYVLLDILNKHVIGSKFDVTAFSKGYDLLEEYQATLQRGMWHVMFIIDQAAEVDIPAKMVAEAIVDAYTSRVWGEEVFSTLFSFLRSRNVSVLRVAFVIVTTLAKICKHDQELSKVIFKTKIVEAVSKIVEVEKRAILCAKVLAEMPNSPESASLIAADSASGKATELEKPVQ